MVSWMKGPLTAVMSAVVIACASSGGHGSRSPEPRPRIVPATEPPCTAEDLQGLSTAAGVVATRSAWRIVDARPVLRREDVHCGTLAAGPCLDWALRHARGRTLGDGVPVEVTGAVRVVDRGTWATLQIDGVPYTESFPDRAAYVARIRTLEDAGSSVVLVSEGRDVDIDPSHVELTYRKADPIPLSVPALDLRIRVPDDPRAVWETYLLLSDDIEAAGAELDDPSKAKLMEFVLEHVVPSEGRHLVDRGTRWQRAVATVALLQAIPPRRRGTESTPPLRLELSVRCTR